MTKKRRQPSSPAESKETNKRVTRSSTRQILQMEHSSNTKPTTFKKEILGNRNKTNPTKPITKTTRKPKDETIDVDSDPIEQTISLVRHNLTPLTISSPIVKKPIQCHHYKPLKPSTSNPSPTLVFTHGAGGTLSAPAVTNFCTGFSSTLPVFAFQGSMNLTARSNGFHACISHMETLEQNEARSENRTIDAKRLLLGGRSMGARAAVMAASSVVSSIPQDTAHKPRVQLVLVSYPLKGPKDVRDGILLNLSEDVEVLFVIGERDVMCPLDLLEDVRRKMRVSSRLVVVRGADHGMGGGGKEREREVGEEAGKVAARWAEGEMSGETMYVGGEG